MAKNNFVPEVVLNKNYYYQINCHCNYYHQQLPLSNNLLLPTTPKRETVEFVHN